MNGVWPKGRFFARAPEGALRPARAGGVALALLLLPACVHGGGGASSVAASQAAAASAAEVQGLKAQLAAREQTIAQLEGRLAMLEAAQRQLRAELEAERAAPALQEAAQRELGARETVRIGARAREARAVAPPAPPVSAPAPVSETRPVLRLSGDRRESDRHALTSTWVEPTTTDRLQVFPVPALSGANPKPGAHAHEARAASGPTSAGASPTRRDDSVSGAAAAVATPAAVKPEVDDLYLHALDLLRRRELPEALRELDAFVSASPHDPRIARAQFWRGELLYAEHQFARALSAYEQALLRDSTGDKAADALLRIARCHRRLGASDRARAALLRLRTQFPDSAAARQAEQEPEPTAQEDT